MTNPVTVENSSEYIKKSDLDALMGKIVSSLQPRIEQIVEQAVQKAIEQTSTKTDEKLAIVKGEIRGEITAKLDQHIEQERQQRQQDIEQVRSQIKDVGDETRAKLGEFTTVVNSASKAVEALDTNIRGWSNSLDANQKLYEDNRRDIEKQDGEIDKIKDDVSTLEETQVATSTKLKSINHAIYGGNADGPKSLYAMLEEMGKKMDKGFEGQQAQTIAALELARNTSVRQDQYEKDLIERKQRWARRRGAAKELVVGAAKTPYFWIVLALSLTAIVTIFRPEALTAFGELVQIMFGTNP